MLKFNRFFNQEEATGGVDPVSDSGVDGVPGEAPPAQPSYLTLAADAEYVVGDRVVKGAELPSLIQANQEAASVYENWKAALENPDELGQLIEGLQAHKERLAGSAAPAQVDLSFDRDELYEDAGDFAEAQRGALKSALSIIASQGARLAALERQFGGISGDLKPVIESAKMSRAETEAMQKASESLGREVTAAEVARARQIFPNLAPEVAVVRMVMTAGNQKAQGASAIPPDSSKTQRYELKPGMSAEEILKIQRARQKTG